MVESAKPLITVDMGDNGLEPDGRNNTLLPMEREREGYAGDPEVSIDEESLCAVS